VWGGTVTEGPSATVSPRWRRVLWAMLPIVIVLLITWVIWLIVEIAIGEASGFSIVPAFLGLASSLGLIVSGREYRRSLRRG
jgi:hypothetical protein